MPNLAPDLADQNTAAHAPPLLSRDESAAALRALQLRVFVLTWVSYASYYFTRKNFSVVKSRLHETLGLSTQALGGIDTVYLSCYALGQFTSGALGDRIGPRRLIAFGMIGSAAASLLFGFSSSLAAFALAFAINGFFQSSGWPGNVKAMQPFFPSSLRGRVMGLWTTNYQAGGLAATALATALLVASTRAQGEGLAATTLARLGWRAAFVLPALGVFAVGVLVYFFLVERPEQRGLPPLEPAPLATGESAAAPEPRLATLLRMPLLWVLGGTYFGLKLIRYSLLFWLPFYLREHLHYSEGGSGYMSILFEVGGIAGSVIVGWLSDRYFRTRRLYLATPLVMLLGGALLAYEGFGAISAPVNGLLLAVCGFLLFGPDSLISGAVSQDIGGARATARVAGIINGMGSVGAVISPTLVAVLSSRFGWSPLFYSFVGITLFSGLLLIVASQMQQASRTRAAAT